MANKFRKLDDGTWGLACGERHERGELVYVERKDGTGEELPVGEYLGVNKFGDHEHRIWNAGNDRPPGGPRPASAGRRAAELSWAAPKTPPRKVDPAAAQDAKGRIVQPLADDDLPF